MTQLKPLAFTKDSFRYCWVEDDEPLCREYFKQLNSVEPNKRIQPAFTKRKIIPSTVKLSSHDRAPQLKLEDNDMKVTGEKGYSMVRATHGINRGTFYYEVHINLLPDNTATRIGWGQCYSNLQAPLGYDHYGYSWRSRYGTKFHQARGKSFDAKGGGYKEGDTIGCMIELPYGNEINCTMAHHLPASVKAGFLVMSKGKKDTEIRMLEEKDEPTPLSEMKTLIGSRISFYKNGQFVGVAYEDIFEGFYYPSISLYKSCSVSVNFGPKFKFPPPNYKPPTLSSRPISNGDSNGDPNRCRSAQDIIEASVMDNLLTDLLYIVDEEVKWELPTDKDGKVSKNKGFEYVGNKLQRKIDECIR